MSNHGHAMTDDKVGVAVEPEHAEVTDMKQVVVHHQDQADHQETAMQALKHYPRVIFWCAYAIWMLFLSSYDNQAGGTVLGIPEFRKDFGYAYDGSYVLPAKWQSAYSGGPTASTVIGALGSSWVADKIGRKLTYCIAVCICLAGISIEVSATQNATFFAGKFILGFSVGTLITISMTYVGEIVPLALRGSVTAACAVAFTLGSFIVSLIVNGVSTREDRWAYRSIFISQYAVVFIGICGLIFMPESPWWLLSKGKEERARRSFKSLGYSPEETETRIAQIKVTLEKVRKVTEGATFMECFRHTNFRRTIVSISPLVIQALGGCYFIAAYSTYYLELGGYSTSMSFKINIAQQVLSLVGNICSWFIVDRVGRRPLTIYGNAFLTILLIITGGLATVRSESYIKGTVALMWTWCFFYNMTIGATAYTLLAEIATARLRTKTAAIGLATQQALFTMWAFVIPYLFNPDEANLGGKIAFIFGALSLVSTIFLWWFQPETMGRSYEELDEMFGNRIPAWKFKGYVSEVQADTGDA